MLYSMVPAAMLIISLILNWELLRENGIFVKKQDKKKQVAILYIYFILSADCYFIVDMSWGIMYEHNDIPQLFPFIYYFTVFYFIFMLMTMLTWTRYIVAYLDERGRHSKMLLYGTWSMFLIG
ncbi:MAG: GGDEF domain-containing protein, partial [Butyrivibrio sp.]|nr:GGDEF domain-containing protein [Butyrivibrio sp.]